MGFLWFGLGLGLGGVIGVCSLYLIIMYLMWGHR